jgi:hypothetical protein
MAKIIWFAVGFIAGAVYWEDIKDWLVDYYSPTAEEEIKIHTSIFEEAINAKL